MNIYCQECGQPNHYGSKKPKFCNYCGISLDGKRTKASKPKKKLTPKKEQIVSQSPVFEETESIPDINHLEVDIEAPKLKGVPFGEVAGTSAGTSNDNPSDEAEEFIAPEGENLSEEEFLRRFKTEAGSLREKGDT